MESLPALQGQAIEKVSFGFALMYGRTKIE
jgi:hypothetical protein